MPSCPRMEGDLASTQAQLAEANRQIERLRHLVCTLMEHPVIEANTAFAIGSGEANGCTMGVAERTLAGIPPARPTPDSAGAEHG
jgi:hypothetical protein